jgi:hypothetical protein
MTGKLKILFLAFFAFTGFRAAAQVYTIDIPAARSIYIAQKQPLWCWAACNQMLLRAKGISETQENQSRKVFGRIINQGAGPNFELSKTGLAGIFQTVGGERVRIYPYVSYLSQHNANDPVVIIDHLDAGIPLVMATKAHARVCTGVDYIKRGGYYQITRLRLLDPLSSPGIVEYTMQQFLNEGLIGFMTYDIR